VAPTPPDRRAWEPGLPGPELLRRYHAQLVFISVSPLTAAFSRLSNLFLHLVDTPVLSLNHRDEQRQI